MGQIVRGFGKYAAGGKNAGFIADFTGDEYRQDRLPVAFADLFTFARTGTATFVDADGILQTAADGVARTSHHIWNGSEWTGPFLQLESEARTNLLHTTNALVTQSTAVTAVPHTLHFTGTGTITLSGASTAGPLVGTGTGENNRVSLTFTPSAASLTLTVTGTVTNAQLEVGSTPSSYIPNLAGSGTATRNAETLTIAAADAPWSALANSIQMEGAVTYADNNIPREIVFMERQLDAQNIIYTSLQTNAGTGQFAFVQEASNVFDFVATDGSVLSTGVDMPFSFAMRNGSTFLNGAFDGTALTANTTPTALPDLSATDIDIGSIFMGSIGRVVIWADDIGDAGIASASA